YWGIDKPIVIGEFPANGVKGHSITEAFEQLYKLGYAGALSWSWYDNQFGGLTATTPALQYLEKTYPNDIIIEPLTISVEEQLLGIRYPESQLEVSIYPNPTLQQVIIEFPEGEVYDDINVTIFNTVGVEVLEQNFILNKELSQKVNISSLSEGVYIMHILNKKSLMNIKYKMVKR
ncbi:MAG: hypothetical protein ACI9QN_002675, partial [Arcticibacterium sp.]